MAKKTTLAVNTVRMREFREAKGLTLLEAAKRAGFTMAQQWHLIERLDKPDVRVSTLGRIAKALGCKPQELFVDKPAKKKGAAK